MQTSGKITSLNSQWQDLQQLQLPNLSQLDNIKPHLDLVLLALKAIASVTAEDVLQAAQELNLTAVIGDRHCPNAEERKKIDLEEVRQLVLIICYLAKQHQELIRRGVSLLEQVSDEQTNEPHHPALLANYVERFINFSQARSQEQDDLTAQSLSQLALKLLIDLLFYSGDNGHRLLWQALFPAAN